MFFYPRNKLNLLFPSGVLASPVPAPGLAALKPPNTLPVAAAGEPKVEVDWADTAPKPLCWAGAPGRDPNNDPVPEPAAGAVPAPPPNPPPKLLPPWPADPNPPPKELPALLAPRLLVEPKVLLPVLAAAPKVLVCPKPAPPNEEAGLLAPNVDAEALGALPKVLVWPKPAPPKEEVDAALEPKVEAGCAPAPHAPRPLVAPKPEVAPNLGAVLLAVVGAPKPVLGVVAGLAKVDVEPKVEAEPNVAAGFTSAAGAAAALLANNEVPAAGLLLPTPQPPFAGEEPLKLTGVAGLGD